jgi:plastocyanin
MVTDSPTPQTEEVLVGPNAENTFDPAGLEVPAGTEVTFVWESAGHNIDVES